MKELLVGTNFKTKPLKLKKGAIPTLDLNLPDSRPLTGEAIQNKVEIKPDRVEGAIRIGPGGKIIVVEKKIPVEPEEIVEIPDVDDDPDEPVVEGDSQQVHSGPENFKNSMQKKLVKSYTYVYQFHEKFLIFSMKIKILLSELKY